MFLCLSPLHSLAQVDNNSSSAFFEIPPALQLAGLNSVTCIHKDRHHMMWFGTNNGLYSYDGTNLHYYKHIDGDSTSLASNTVEQITEDANGHLWIALIKGVSEIDLSTFKIKNYTSTNRRLDVPNYTNRICSDNKNIWVGNNAGIFEYDEKTDTFKKVWDEKLLGYALSDYVTHLLNGDGSQLIATTFHDIIILNKINHSFKRIPVIVSMPPKDSSLTCALLDSKHTLWIGTWGGGIYTYDLAKGKLTHVNCLQPIYNMPHFYITSIYETTFGNQRTLWASSPIGLVKCNVDDSSQIKDFALIKYNKEQEHPIIPGKLTDLYFDDDGAMWCVGDVGVCRYFPYRNNFKYFAGLNGLIQGIQKIPLDNDTCLFVYSWNDAKGNGLLATTTSGKESQLKINPGFTDKDDGRSISGVVKDRYNRLWISSMAGLSVLDEKYHVIHQWNKNTTGANALSYYRTAGILLHNDTIWVVCYHRGIDLFDMSFKKIKHIIAGDNSGMKDNVIFSLYNDTKGNLWVCGDNNFYKYLPATGKFRLYSLTKEMTGCSPHDVAETKNGQFFIASMEGLIKFDPVTEDYSYVLSGILEKEQHVYSVAIDKKDNVWFLTDRHLALYTPGQNHFILFGDEDALATSEGLNLIRTFNGTDFYLCQDSKVITFNSDNLCNTVTPPYMSLIIKANDSLVSRNDSNTALVLPYDKNRLQFEFTGISYTKAAQNQYYYQLSDIDEQWNITYKNSVSYAHLAPGSYSFKVKAINYAGVWSDSKIIHFIITPPYWQTLWFRITTILIVFSILFFVIRYVSQRNLKERILILEKEKAVEKERNRIARDMHDDLGSGLTKIAILSEVVKKQITQPDKAFEQLERISDSSRNLVDNLQDIVWMLNTKHDQVGSLAIYIREYATKYFEQSGTTITFDYPAQIDPIKLREEQRRNLYMAVKEALNNIAKHAQATAVKITFHVYPRTLEFVISDDGKGFDMNDTRQFSNGLSNMRNRMKQVGGECAISTEAGKGTVITFSLPV